MNQRKLALLFKLQENPVAPAAVLAKQVGISPPTARAWLESLRREQVIGGVQASLKVRNLGLEMYDYHARVESYNALQKIEKFCDVHPYTSYRARFFGGKNHGIILQFRQPESALPHLEEALKVMQDEGLLRDTSEQPTLSAEYGSLYTYPALEAWDPENLFWNFDWDNWWAKAPKKVKSPSSKKIQVVEKLTLDELDVKLLQEITFDARRKNTEIIKKLGLDKDKIGVQQKISSKIKRLEEKAVDSYRVFINWNHFDVYNTPLVIAKANTDVTGKLMVHLESSDFPFGSTIRQIPGGFVWSARLPAAHLSELVALIWRITESYELLTIDYKHSEVYGLWAETFDVDQEDWRSDSEFCLTKPLGEIGLA